ncbi:UbiD family decarboxylase [Klebsiella pneumoniae subsp. pneumoniae]|nr:UbiD family decarboxylase [Klebsiella pneumoniae subsp. pneumoniae]
MKAGRGQAALLALATYSELKNIILVDEDVDIFDSDDILWAMTTRMQGDVSITTIPGIRRSPAGSVPDAGIQPVDPWKWHQLQDHF